MNKKEFVKELLNDPQFNRFFKIGAFGDSPSLSKAKKGMLSEKNAEIFLKNYEDLLKFVKKIEHDPS